MTRYNDGQQLQLACGRASEELPTSCLHYGKSWKSLPYHCAELTPEEFTMANGEGGSAKAGPFFSSTEAFFTNAWKLTSPSWFTTALIAFDFRKTSSSSRMRHSYSSFSSNFFWIVWLSYKDTCGRMSHMFSYSTNALTAVTPRNRRALKLRVAVLCSLLAVTLSFLIFLI